MLRPPASCTCCSQLGVSKFNIRATGGLEGTAATGAGEAWMATWSFFDPFGPVSCWEKPHLIPLKVGLRWFKLRIGNGNILIGINWIYNWDLLTQKPVVGKQVLGFARGPKRGGRVIKDLLGHAQWLSMFWIDWIIKHHPMWCFNCWTCWNIAGLLAPRVDAGSCKSDRFVVSTHLPACFLKR